VGGPLLCLMLVSGCSTETRHRLLHVFFTGVDRTNAAPAVVSVAEPPRQAAFAVPVAQPDFIHKPYGESQCAACHLTAESQQLRVTGGALCLECHSNLLADAKYVHAPVEAGACDLCHEPHRSTEPSLLKRKSQELCLECHSSAIMAKVKAHTTNEAALCIECHDAHRSNRPKLARISP